MSCVQTRPVGKQEGRTAPVTQYDGTFALNMSVPKITIGRLEHIALTDLGVPRVIAKIDTGAYRSAIHYQDLGIRTVNGERKLVVTFQMGGVRKKMIFSRFKRVKVKSSNGSISNRYLISTVVRLNDHAVRTQFTLFDRSDMKFQVLLGRKFLQGRFLVDVSEKYLLG
ncbi:MAG: RimK/LysX family protein [Flavobacteriales bacterium]|nr:ATP-dependent zinc protease [Flavobacteriales bacterium]